MLYKVTQTIFKLLCRRWVELGTKGILAGDEQQIGRKKHEEDLGHCHVSQSFVLPAPQNLSWEEANVILRPLGMI